MKFDYDGVTIDFDISPEQLDTVLQRFRDYDGTQDAKNAFITGIKDDLHHVFESGVKMSKEDYEKVKDTINIEKFVLVAILKTLEPRLIELEAKERSEQTRVLFGKDTHLTTFTEKTASKLQRSNIVGQLQIVMDEHGEPSIVDDSGHTFTDAIKSGPNYKNLDMVLMEAIGTAIEAQYKNGHRGRFAIARREFVDFLGVELPKPPKKVLDFIVRGGMETPEEELTEDAKKLKGTIIRHYSYWVEIVKLDHAGMLPTPNGSSYKALHFIGYDREYDAIVLESDYYEAMFEYLDKKKIESKAKKNDESVYKIEQVEHKLKGKLASVKNKITVEVVHIILERIVQRGNTPDAVLYPHYRYKNKRQITIDIGYGDLMTNSYQLRTQLNGKYQKNSKLILDRAIFGNEKTKKNYYIEHSTKRDGVKDTYKEYIPFLEYVINEYTVFKKAYKNFKIICDPIDMKETKKRPLKYGIHITHEGINGEYKNNPELLPPTIE